MDRHAFLQRIAARLGRTPGSAPPPRTAIGLPEPAPVLADPVARFCSELDAVGGTAHRVRDAAELRRVLRAVLEQYGARRIVTAAPEELAAFELGWLWSSPGVRAVGEPGLAGELELRHALAAADVGLTPLDFGLADSGSLVLGARAGIPRGLSLLPALHVALLQSSQIVGRLDLALAAYGARELPAAIHVITGPSRTSDIENDLTIGVHGPAAVVAIVLEERP